MRPLFHRRADGTAPTHLVEIFLISAAALLLEIAYTRIISFKLYYYYTYLVIGLALLGLGSGAVIVAVSKRLDGLGTRSLLARCAVASTVGVAIGYVAVATTPLDTIEMWTGGRGPQLAAMGQLLVIALAGIMLLGVGVHLADVEWRTATGRAAAAGAAVFAVLYHDGTWGSAIWPWDGDPTSLDRFDDDVRSVPFAALGTPPERMLIIGAAGGHEIEAATSTSARNRSTPSSSTRPPPTCCAGSTPSTHRTSPIDPRWTTWSATAGATSPSPTTTTT